jgi:hypothetical protein
MEMMGSEPGTVMCSGCDVCDGDNSATEEGRDELLDFFGLNGRRYDRNSAILHLGGAGTAVLPRCAGSGLLSRWTRKDIALLVAAGKRAGLVEESQAFPWKGRMGLTEAGMRSWKKSRSRGSAILSPFSRKGI